MKRFGVVLSTILLTIGVMLGFSTPAHAAGYPWHILNNVNSIRSAYAFGDTGCTSSRYTISPGKSVVSTDWDSFDYETWYTYMIVDVFDGATGRHIVKRIYRDQECIKAYKTNDYKVTILEK